MRRRAFASVLVAAAVRMATAASQKRPKTLTMEATAHSVEGETAAGTRSRPGTAAADPRVLPLGSRIRVNGAGAYSGEYSVEDTGRTIRGREIDLYMRSDAEAKRFGRQRVQVTVLEYGRQARN
jgi:3D (Asp-Asp-Asp) domain-containing protein